MGQGGTGIGVLVQCCMECNSLLVIVNGDSEDLFEFSQILNLEVFPK